MGMDGFISSKRSLLSVFGPDLLGPENVRVYPSCQPYTTHRAQAAHDQLHPLLLLVIFNPLFRLSKALWKRKKKKVAFVASRLAPLQLKKKWGEIKVFYANIYFFSSFFFFWKKNNESWFDDCDWGLWPCREINSMWKTCKPIETKRHCCWTTQVSWLHIDLNDDYVHWRLSR